MPYDPQQPRDWHGRWTDDNIDRVRPDEVQDVRDFDDIFPEPLDGMSPECRAEWEWAIKFCGTLMLFGKLRRGSGFGQNMKKCVYGSVSEKCGGNKVDKGPGGPKNPGGRK
jgi:hypothetical protein